jgi:hypothetical protein
VSNNTMDHCKKALLGVLRVIDRDFGNSDLGEIAANSFMKPRTDLSSLFVDVAFGGDQHARNTSVSHGSWVNVSACFEMGFEKVQSLNTGTSSRREKPMGHLLRAAGISATLSLSATS